MKVFFVHGALVFDGAWWWHRMVEPLPHSAWPPGPWSCRAASLLRAPLERLWGHVRRRRRGRRRSRRGGRFRGAGGPLLRGMVITDAASGQENVKRLVYVTSVMPERGETLASFGVGAWSVDGPARRGRHDGHKGRARARRVHAGLRRGDGDGGTPSASPPTLAAFEQAPRSVAWREKPSTYVVCTEDRATPRTHSAATRGGRIAWWSC